MGALDSVIFGDGRFAGIRLKSISKEKRNSNYGINLGT